MTETLTRASVVRMKSKKRRGGYRWNPVGDLNPAFKGGKIADKAWFTEHYCDLGMSLREVAKAAGCSLRTAARWASIHGVPTRSGKEARALKPQRGQDNPNWKGGDTNSCLDCGDKITRYSERCFRCSRAAYAGEGNPNWKGIADIMVLVREHAKLTWQPAVFKRDGFRCIRCGDDRGGNLTAHHVHRLEALVTEIIQDLPTDTPSDRLAAVDKIKSDPRVNDVSNGATLCEDCHREIHRGRRSAVVPVR